MEAGCRSAGVARFAVIGGIALQPPRGMATPMRAAAPKHCVDRRHFRLERAAPKDLDAFLSERPRMYRNQYGQSPAPACSPAHSVHQMYSRASVWRAGTVALLPLTIPPSSDSEPHLAERGLQADYVRCCLGFSPHLL
jgi:hypothetical protein